MSQSLDDAFFYLKVWKSRTHTCQCGCGQQVKGEPTKNNFHHILFKEFYPEYRHCEWNILIIRTDCHNTFHFNPDNRPVIQKLQKEMEEKYPRKRLKRQIGYIKQK